MTYCCCFWIDMYGDEDSDNWKTGTHSLWDMGVEILEAWAVLSLEDLILGCGDLQALSPHLLACTTYLAQIGQKGALFFMFLTFLWLVTWISKWALIYIQERSPFGSFCLKWNLWISVLYTLILWLLVLLPSLDFNFVPALNLIYNILFGLPLGNLASLQMYGGVRAGSVDFPACYVGHLYRLNHWFWFQSIAFA